MEWKELRHLLPLIGLLCLPACATIVEGSSQSVSVFTQPVGAFCSVDRNGERLGSMTTPGNLNISKSKRDLLVTCQKEGYQPASLTQPSRFVGTTFGNIIAGGLVGFAVDASSGANFTYPNEVRLSLNPSAPASATAPAPTIPLAPAARGPDYVPPYVPYTGS